jgi:ribonuclease HII
MTACLKTAFSRAIADIERQGVQVDRVLLDGNPLGIDKREVNVIKGDAQCACIAAASIIAKVARDTLMESYAKLYPSYGFEKNKGYGSAAHMDAISRFGLSPIHRRSFCHFYEQQTLF